MASYQNTRFTLMAFPQSVDAYGRLSLNIVFIPRNISPLEAVALTCPAPAAASAPPFVSVKPEFTVMVVNKPDEFPGKAHENERSLNTAPLVYSPDMQKLYHTLLTAKHPNGKPKYFDIDETRSAGKPNPQHAPDPLPVANSVKKYLPVSYRQAFNFTSPRHPNAVIDDSYRCALREKTDLQSIVAETKVSWGKVYAHMLRQPLLAARGGMIYQTTVQLQEGDLAKGGWIYVTIKENTTYYTEFQASLSDDCSPFIVRYAARMPMLKKGEARSLFASVLFPVMQQGKEPDGNWDDLYVEAARYTDGFATIVHANQPVSQNLLAEEQDGFHPQKEMGIRLGWEDEQILVWYLRQLAKDDTVSDGGRLDAPLGVFGYHIDVRRNGDQLAPWESLTAVKSNGVMMLEDIAIGTFPDKKNPDGTDNVLPGELPFQVYPTRLDSAGGVNYWLPLYYGNWNDACMVLPDQRAAMLYGNKDDKKRPVTVSDTYLAVNTETRLLYGKTYDFRVRMSDISGGGPNVTASSAQEIPSQIATIPFKRYIAPNSLRILNKTFNTAAEKKLMEGIVFNTGDVNFSGNNLMVARPLLGYPAVVYTGKYDHPIQKLLDSLEIIKKGQKAEAVGIPDPDVVKVEIQVEVESLQLDNLASDNGRERYITLYRTFRYFPENFNANLSIPIDYVDIPVLDFENQQKPFRMAELDAAVRATSGRLVLPTARTVRLTLRAVCEGDGTYWGAVDDANRDKDSRYGKKSMLSVRRPSKHELELFTGTIDPKVLQGIYLQPDPVEVRPLSAIFKTLQDGTGGGMPDILQRLAKALNIECKGLTLLAENGERLQFWCSNLVRHSMAPDNSSLTFSNRNELSGHWFVCTTLFINRDWSWDGLADISFTISRRHLWGPKIQAEKEAAEDTGISDAYAIVGDLELRRTASFQAIQPGNDGKVHREYTRVIFIDVIDMKPVDEKFPDTLTLQYRIEPFFRKVAPNTMPTSDGAFQTQALTLPTSVNPTQLPKLIGAGIALSPYVRDKAYAATEPRRRFLWLEFDCAPHDPHDDLFCRMLACSPDQLLSNNALSLMELPEESPLPLDPEYVRVITPASADEHAGLNAMQKMEKSIDAGRHFYLVPLPPGMHPESPELFGMFTYEFRYGHSGRIWSTAQGRYGRKLRVCGLQHPAPNLSCAVTRSEEKICVSAPFARAVANGRNVTADPPRTTLWCLLYAQVMQADGFDFRNILLGRTQLHPPDLDAIKADFGNRIEMAKRKWMSIRSLQMELEHIISRDKDVGRFGTGCWCHAEITAMLDQYGLPLKSSLSVLCVEVYGQITNISEHIDYFSREKIYQEAGNIRGSIFEQFIESLQDADNIEARKTDRDPLGSELGHHRILRTSPLTPVPAICCSNCE